MHIIRRSQMSNENLNINITRTQNTNLLAGGGREKLCENERTTREQKKNAATGKTIRKTKPEK